MSEAHAVLARSRAAWQRRHRMPCCYAAFTCSNVLGRRKAARSLLQWLQSLGMAAVGALLAHRAVALGSGVLKRSGARACLGSGPQVF